MAPIDFELKEKSKPVFSRPYPIPKEHGKFQKEVGSLFLLLVLENDVTLNEEPHIFLRQKQKLIKYK